MKLLSLLYAFTAMSSPALAAEMIAIPAGSYTLGADNGPLDARPAHQVKLAAFQIDKHEVTNADVAAFLNAGGIDVKPLKDAAAGEVTAEALTGKDVKLVLEALNTNAADAFYLSLDDEDSSIGISEGKFVAAPGRENRPAGEISWYGARAYCAWRNARLPTEAEFEAAARGKDARRYPWGDALPTAKHAVFGRGVRASEDVGTHPTGNTPEGLQDMAGNLTEWTSTLYRPYPYDAADGREDDQNPGDRVTRGGEYRYTAVYELDAFHRGGFFRSPMRGHADVGFRCAK